MPRFATQNLHTEHLDLIVTAQSGSSDASRLALDTLVGAYHPAIDAASHASSALDPEDGYQVAAEAFINAVRNFDVDGDTPFAATIASILRRAVLREARASDLVQVKDNTAAKYWRLMHKHGMDANAAYAECVAEVNDFSPATFLAAHAALGDTMGDVADKDIYDTLAGAQPDEAVIRADYVAWLFTKVSEIQESILRLRYGFDDIATQKLLATWNDVPTNVLLGVGEPIPSDLQVGDVLDIPRSTVNRQARKAIDAMRAADAEALAEEIAAEQ